MDNTENNNYQLKAGLSILILFSIFVINIYFSDLAHGIITFGLLLFQVLLIWRKLLPNLYLIMIPFVAILYMLGSRELLDLYYILPWYDKIVHFSMEFMLTLLAGSILVRRYSFYYQNQILFLITIVSLGIALGAIWEIIEWFITLVIPPTFKYTVLDTIGDLIIDSYGVFMASLVHLFWLRRK